MPVMTNSMTIKVKDTPESKLILEKGVSVPSFVLDKLLGQTFDVPATARDLFEVSVEWLGKPSTWSLPAECVEIVKV